MINYEEQFPLPLKDMPTTLQRLFSPIAVDRPFENVDVTSRIEKNKYKPEFEYLHMIMACVPEGEISSLKVLDEASNGAVMFSKPCCNDKGGLYPLNISVSGYDYIVASWGDSSHYSYSLAEKVWMTLGLSPRVIGNSEQKIIYDDLSLPILKIAEGDLASEYMGKLTKNVNWTMRNDYLRNYLWKIGCCGVRIFFYEAYIDETQDVLNLMNGQSQVNLDLGHGWGHLCIRKANRGEILLQLYASICAIDPVLCAEKDIHALIWPGESQPMTSDRAQSYINSGNLYFDDKLLEKYERNSMFDAVPFKYCGSFWSSPSYKGEWSYVGLERVGRNILKTSVYDLYKGTSDPEILYAYNFAIPENEALNRGYDEEHIVSKSERLLLELITLGEGLSKLVNALTGGYSNSEEYIEFTRQAYQEEGFRDFPLFQKLSQVAPLAMHEQDFLSRCKLLNEIITRVKVKPLRNLLISLGVSKKDIQGMQCLKLLQIILNITQYANEQGEGLDALASLVDSIDWKKQNKCLAPLFINNDLRNSEAHESIGETILLIERIGFDTALLNEGYGRSLDFILDGVIEGISEINENISQLLLQ